MAREYLRSVPIVAGLAALLAGCASYRPAPISAAQNAQAIEARSLDDPRLRTFIEATRASGESADAGSGAANVPIEAQPVGADWDLSALILAALYYHPDLDLARADVAEARAAAQTARQVHNPSLGFEDLSYNPSASAGSAWIIAPVINFLIETAGKRKQRTAQATALLRAARADLVSASWQVRAGVRNALIDLWAAERRRDLLRERAALQGQLATLLEHRYAVGEVSGLELARERNAGNQAGVAVGDAERVDMAARSQLAAAIGIPLHALESVRLNFDTLDAIEQPAADSGGELRQEALVARSDVQSRLADYAAAESALALETANQYPNLTLSPGYAWDAGQHRYLLLPATELPIFNRNQGPIAQALARRERAAARFTALQTQIIDAIDGAAASYRAASRTLATADLLLNGEQDRERRTLRSFQAGAIDRPTLLSQQLERIAAAEVRLDAAAQHRRALAAVEDALQHPFFGPVLPAGMETNPRVAVQSQPRATSRQDER